MEKIEAIREYCVDKALQLIAKSPKLYSAKELTDIAKEIEKYITK